MRRYTEQQVRRTILKYETRHSAVNLDGAPIDILEIVDAYDLLDRLLEQEESNSARPVRFPYWAEIWPASVALSSWLLKSDLQLPTRGGVKELGCGLGLVGVALARSGVQVEATDFVEDALVFATHNARRNGASLLHRVSYLDWSHPVGSPSPCLIGSDVTYEKQSHQYLYRTIRKLLAPGGRLLLSDPRRPVARPFFSSLKQAGFAHAVASETVQWKSISHEVDIHLFTRPA